MSTIQCLRVLVKQILSAAADEILEAVEKMIAAGEEEMSQEELDVTEDFLGELQKLSSSPRQKYPECLQTERSHKEPLSSSQEEDDRRPLPFTSAEQMQSIEADEDSNVSQIQDLLVPVVKQAADRIVEAVEMIPVKQAADRVVEAVEMISDHEGEIHQSKRDIGKPEELDVTEDFLSELQKLISSPRQKYPECLQTERSHKEPLSSSQEEEDRRPFTSAEQMQSIEADEDSNMSQIQDLLVPVVKQAADRIVEAVEMIPVKQAADRIVEAVEMIPVKLAADRIVEAVEMIPVKQAADRIVEALEMISDHEGEIHQSKRDIGILDEMDRGVEEPLPGPSAEPMITEADEEVPPPVLSEAENKVGDDRNAAQGAHNDRSEESHKTACGVCGKVFPQTPKHRRLKVHMRSHVGEFRCEVCGESFSFHRNLTRHLRTHEREEPFRRNPTPPDVDDSIESQVDKLTAAISARTRSHTRAKRFRCDVCDKAFRQRSALADHLRIHNGERPYLCTTCNKYFRTKSNLRQHMDQALYHIKNDDSYLN